MNTKTERNWQLIVAGILFIIFGLVCAFFPGLTLASIAFIVGAAFVVSGVVNIATFIRDRDLLGFSGWILAYGILDVLIGAMFVIHPFAFAAVLPWVIGAFVLVFGIYEVVATFMVKRAGPSPLGLDAVLGRHFHRYRIHVLLYARNARTVHRTVRSSSRRGPYCCGGKCRKVFPVTARLNAPPTRYALHRS